MRRAHITVRDLVDMLERFDPNAVVVVPGTDHSYRSLVHTCQAEAEQCPDGELVEWYGDQHRSDPQSKVVEVVVFT